MEFGGNTKQQAIYCWKPLQGQRSHVQDSVLQTYKQCQITMLHTTTREKGEENTLLCWKFSNKWRPESHSACFPIHASWQLLVKLATGRGKGSRGLSSGPYFETEKPINLAARPSLSRVPRGQDAVWSPKWRSKFHFLSDYLIHLSHYLWQNRERCEILWLQNINMPKSHISLIKGKATHTEAA